MSPIGLAVIGAGYWGPNLVRTALATPGLRLKWLCDLELERARPCSARAPRCGPPHPTRRSWRTPLWPRSRSRRLPTLTSIWCEPRWRPASTCSWRSH